MTIDEAKEWLHKEVPTEILLERIYEEFKLELEAEYKRGWRDRHTQSDLESRTCENCMHNKDQDNFMIFCDCVMCLDGSRMMWHSYTKDFCCNKWEQK